MIFRGWQKESLIEWPNKICTVVFVGGCNLRCPFCHNSDLVLNPNSLPSITPKEILDYLEENRNLIDGLMVTGGEPLMPPQFFTEPSAPLIKFLQEVKSNHFLIGIETNGLNPNGIKYLIKKNLLDFVSMDIKTALNEKKYQKATGVKFDLNNLNKIKESIKIIMQSGKPYEFKTTVVPGLVTKNDILEIAKYIKSAQRYVIQKFNPESTLDKNFDWDRNFSDEWFLEIKEQVRKYIKEVIIR